MKEKPNDKRQNEFNKEEEKNDEYKNRDKGKGEEEHEIETSKNILGKGC